MALLKTRPLPQPVARALDALWSCLPYTQVRLQLDLPDYETRRAYFNTLIEYLISTPPRLDDIPQ